MRRSTGVAAGASRSRYKEGNSNTFLIQHSPTMGTNRFKLQTYQLIVIRRRLSRASLHCCWEPNSGRSGSIHKTDLRQCNAIRLLRCRSGPTALSLIVWEVHAPVPKEHRNENHALNSATQTQAQGVSTTDATGLETTVFDTRAFAQ